MTEALYLKNAYLKEWEAEVVEVNSEEMTIVLDKTAFYARGGGQVSDIGEIETPDDKVRVLFVEKKDGKIYHEIDDIGLSMKPGLKVRCKLNWERRYQLMKSHTATHILAQVLYNNEDGVLITGNQIDIEKCRIDFALEKNDPEAMKKYIAQANEVIKQDLDVTIDFKPREEAFKIPQLSKLAKGFPENIQEVRIVSIGDFDIQADGGTHVNNTSEIKGITFLKTDNRGKNNRRVYFKVE